ncbi:MAG TPA: DNA internalization-related competence protein ComEC/Rec2 [Bacillota bacterium]
MGIWSGWRLGGVLHRLLSGLVLIGCAVCFFLFSTDQNRTKDRKGVCLLISALLLAAGLGFYRGAGERAGFERSLAAIAPLLRAGREATITGTVVGEVRKWRNGQRFVFRMDGLLSADQGFPGVEGRPSGGPFLKCEVFLEEPLARDPEVGDCLKLTGVFSTLTWPDDVENPTITWWTREKIVGGFFVKGMGHVVLAGKPRLNPVTVYISRLRRRLLRISEETLSPQSAGVLHSMLFGEWIEFDQQTTEGIRRTGVAHLFSVSGLHLIFWLSLFLGIGKLLRLPAPLLTFLSIPVVLVFLLIAGLRPPAIRAAVMYFLALVGKNCAQPRNRVVSGENLLSVAACLSLLWRPLDLFSKSFWLSYGACVGIFVFYPPWKQALGRWGQYQPVQAVLLSTVIQIVIMPLLINFFGGVSVLTPIANLLLVPLATLALQIGLLAAVGGFFFFPAAQLLNAGNELILNNLCRLLQACSTSPGYLPAEPWPWLTVGCFYVTLTILTLGVSKNPVTKRRRIPLFYFYLAILLPAVVFIGWNLIFQTNPDLTMVVFDVGQGDSILLSTADGCHILVDGGTREGFATGVKPYLEANGLTNLDLLVVTHPHEDHLGGAVRLLEEGKVNVRMVLDSGHPHTTSLYQEFISLIKEKRIPYQRAVRGMDFWLGGGEPRWHGLVLHPPNPFLSGTGADLNNNSIVLLLTYGPVRILLTGDLEVRGKEDLLTAYHGSLHAQILKVAHHGSAGANSRLWLQRTAPEIAIISVGRENPFGHPSTAVIQDLQSSGARVWRTDLDGQLVLEIKILGTKGKVMVRRGK